MSTTTPRPPRPARRWLRFLAIVTLIALLPFVVVGTTIAATGTVTVQVHERTEGVHLWLPVPALLFDVAAFVAPRLIPEQELASVHAELEPWRPALVEAVRALEDCPSGLLVEVVTASEHVRVSKDGRSFRVSVESPDVDVKVAVPARIARRALQALDLM
ncbi:MAG: hypothetical protein D6696_19080 [Acidobacteria bacterium]|nr:MAG: hypothetical protein D6696_19080 [Acidobacteriota bacterium]